MKKKVVLLALKIKPYENHQFRGYTASFAISQEPSHPPMHLFSTRGKVSSQEIHIFFI